MALSVSKSRSFCHGCKVQYGAGAYKGAFDNCFRVVKDDTQFKYNINSLLKIQLKCFTECGEKK